MDNTRRRWTAEAVDFDGETCDGFDSEEVFVGTATEAWEYFDAKCDQWELKNSNALVGELRLLSHGKV